MFIKLAPNFCHLTLSVLEQSRSSQPPRASSISHLLPPPSRPADRSDGRRQFGYSATRRAARRWPYITLIRGTRRNGPSAPGRELIEFASEEKRPARAIGAAHPAILRTRAARGAAGRATIAPGDGSIWSCRRLDGRHIGQTGT